ncbi:unnamed protein product [Menidia menidia]|uniref:(Atlantic silverside) hypothetical protein n=1 Tax=Menidia menidia TaxID=238744 RepID=A0A8S4B828_9TELE|nr:unnamed protein product [Menidia menidia]
MKMRPPVKPMATTMSLVQKGHSSTPEDTQKHTGCRSTCRRREGSRWWCVQSRAYPAAYKTNLQTSISESSEQGCAVPPFILQCFCAVGTDMSPPPEPFSWYFLLRASRHASSSVDDSDCGAPEWRSRGGSSLRFLKERSLFSPSSLRPIQIVKSNRNGMGSGHRGNKGTALKMMEVPFNGFELTFIIIAFVIFSFYSLASVCIPPWNTEPETETFTLLLDT